MRRENVAVVVAAIIDWTPIAIGQEDFRFSDGKAIELLMRPDMGWALEQIAKAQASETTFRKAIKQPVADG